MAISLGCRLLDTSSGLPGSRNGPDQPANGRFCRAALLFGLAPGGVCLAKRVTPPAGELLPHRFTLTAWPKPLAAVCFLLHFPWPRGRSALPTTLSLRSPDFPLAMPPSDMASDHPVHFKAPSN